MKILSNKTCQYNVNEKRKHLLASRKSTTKDIKEQIRQTKFESIIVPPLPVTNSSKIDESFESLLKLINEETYSYRSRVSSFDWTASFNRQTCFEPKPDFPVEATDSSVGDVESPISVTAQINVERQNSLKRKKAVPRDTCCIEQETQNRSAASAPNAGSRASIENKQLCVQEETSKKQGCQRRNSSCEARHSKDKSAERKRERDSKKKPYTLHHDLIDSGSQTSRCSRKSLQNRQETIRSLRKNSQNKPTTNENPQTIMGKEANGINRRITTAEKTISPSSFHRLEKPQDPSLTSQKPIEKLPSIEEATNESKYENEAANKTKEIYLVDKLTTNKSTKECGTCQQVEHSSKSTVTIKIKESVDKAIKTEESLSVVESTQTCENKDTDTSLDKMRVSSASQTKQKRSDAIIKCKSSVKHAKVSKEKVEKSNISDEEFIENIEGSDNDEGKGHELNIKSSKSQPNVEAGMEKTVSSLSESCQFPDAVKCRDSSTNYTPLNRKRVQKKMLLHSAAQNVPDFSKLASIGCQSLNDFNKYTVCETGVGTEYVTKIIKNCDCATEASLLNENKSDAVTSNDHDLFQKLSNKYCQHPDYSNLKLCACDPDDEIHVSYAAKSPQSAKKIVNVYVQHNDNDFNPFKDRSYLIHQKDVERPETYQLLSVPQRSFSNRTGSKVSVVLYSSTSMNQTELPAANDRSCQCPDLTTFRSCFCSTEDENVNDVENENRVEFKISRQSSQILNSIDKEVSTSAEAYTDPLPPSDSELKINSAQQAELLPSPSGSLRRSLDAIVSSNTSILGSTNRLQNDAEISAKPKMTVSSTNPTEEAKIEAVEVVENGRKEAGSQTHLLDEYVQQAAPEEHSSKATLTEGIASSDSDISEKNDVYEAEEGCDCPEELRSCRCVGDCRQDSQFLYTLHDFTGNWIVSSKLQVQSKNINLFSDEPHVVPNNELIYRDVTNFEEVLFGSEEEHDEFIQEKNTELQTEKLQSTDQDIDIESKPSYSQQIRHSFPTRYNSKGVCTRKSTESMLNVKDPFNNYIVHSTELLKSPFSRSGEIKENSGQFSDVMEDELNELGNLKKSSDELWINTINPGNYENQPLVMMVSTKNKSGNKTEVSQDATYHTARGDSIVSNNGIKSCECVPSRPCYCSSSRRNSVDTSSSMHTALDDEPPSKKLKTADESSAKKEKQKNKSPKKSKSPASRTKRSNSLEKGTETKRSVLFDHEWHTALDQTHQSTNTPLPKVSKTTNVSKKKNKSAPVECGPGTGNPFCRCPKPAAEKKSASTSISDSYLKEVGHPIASSSITTNTSQGKEANSLTNFYDAESNTSKGSVVSKSSAGSKGSTSKKKKPKKEISPIEVKGKGSMNNSSKSLDYVTATSTLDDTENKGSATSKDGASSTSKKKSPKKEISLSELKRKGSINLTTKSLEYLTAATSTSNETDSKGGKTCWAVAQINLQKGGVRELEILEVSPSPPGQYIVVDKDTIMLVGNQPSPKKKN